MQRVPHGILRAHVNGVHLPADAEVCAGVDAQGRGADDAVERVLEVRGVGRVHGGYKLRLVCVRLGDVGIEVTHEADVVVGECVGGEHAGDKVQRVDEFERCDLVGEWAGCDAAAARAVGDNERGSKRDGAGVVE